MTNNNFCVSVNDLYFKYKSVSVLDGIFFNLEYGKVLGFLGSNGAGKTTTVKILCTLLKPTRGKVKVFDKDVITHSKEIKKKIGVIFQNPSFEDNLTVYQAIDLYGRLWDIDRSRIKAKIQELLVEFDLKDIENTKTSEISIGQKRRVQLAREFIHEMDLLFLDEPTVGLDPYARRLLLDYIKTKVKSGLTVFFTTHIMEEAEYLCDKIAILNKGKIITVDTPIGLKEKFGNIKVIEIKLSDKINEDIKRIASSQLLYESDITFSNEDTIRINSSAAQEIMANIINTFSRNGVTIRNISIHSPTLEDVFLTIIKDKL
jgi:ABC-2 type transport system ATP-binding protein